MENDKMTGVWKFYSVNGHLYSIIPYVNGLKEGEAKYYHNNGKLAAIGQFKSEKALPESWKTYNKDGESLDCHCPPPSKLHISTIGSSLYQKEMASTPRIGMAYGYQEYLWEISCVDVKNDSLEEAIKKVRSMWSIYRELIIAPPIPNSVATDKSILKFSVDVGFTTMFTELLRRYKVDVNFVDPKDGYTILDFIEDRIQHVRNSPPVDVEKLQEFEMYVQMLKERGVQHYYEIKRPSDYVLYKGELIERD